MRHCAVFAGLFALAAGSASAQQLAPSPTLDAIKARGHVECGVHLGLPGFSFANDKGEWSGIDVDYCKALAAANSELPAYEPPQLQLSNSLTQVTLSGSSTVAVAALANG